LRSVSGRAACKKHVFGSMINANEEVLSAPTRQTRRRLAESATRNIKTKVRTAKKPLDIQRVFSSAGTSPFDQVEWEQRTAEISDDARKVIFKQENVEVPASWSLLATKVVVSKYFYGELGTPERETSVRQLIHRICRTIADWGIRDGYFTKETGEVFFE